MLKPTENSNPEEANLEQDDPLDQDGFPTVFRGDVGMMEEIYNLANKNEKTLSSLEEWLQENPQVAFL